MLLGVVLVVTLPLQRNTLRVCETSVTKTHAPPAGESVTRVTTCHPAGLTDGVFVLAALVLVVLLIPMLLRSMPDGTSVEGLGVKVTAQQRKDAADFEKTV